MKIIRCLHVRYKRKAFIVLFLYMMGFGYMYSHFLSYISTQEQYGRLFNHYVDQEPFLEAEAFHRLEKSMAKDTKITKTSKANLHDQTKERNRDQQNGAIGMALNVKAPLPFIKRVDRSSWRKNVDKFNNQLRIVQDSKSLDASSVFNQNVKNRKEPEMNMNVVSLTAAAPVKSNSNDKKKSFNMQKSASVVKKTLMKKSNSKIVKPSHEVKKGQPSLKKSYANSFSYPLEINLQKLVQEIESGKIVNGTKPINPHPYHFLYTPSHSCEYEANTTKPTAVILVKSKAENFERRNTIRNTWAKWVPNNVHLAFLLGLPKKGNLGVRKESSKYKDIIEEDFIDDYRNNTVKMIMGFKWAALYCQEADYLFFVDDDYFVNVPNIVQYIKSIKESEKESLFSGTLLPRSVPYRAKGSKWYISWDDYPFDRWPPYLAGGAYFVALSLARKFALAFPYVRPMHIDDVYLGIVAKKLGIRPKGCSKIGYTKRQQHALKSLIASHGYANKAEVERAWATLTRERVKQQIPPHQGNVKQKPAHQGNVKQIPTHKGNVKQVPAHQGNIKPAPALQRNKQIQPKRNDKH